MALGPVKPWVKTAANSLAARFGIRTMYGWRPVDPFPDHPSGLAVDFMVSNLPNGRAVGDALAAYAVQNAGPLNIRYIIWYRQSWNDSRKTWVKYTSTTNPHTDHVHITFNAAAGSGGTESGGVTANPVSLPGVDEIKQLVEVFKSAAKVFAWVNDPHNWTRVGIGGLGGALIVFGLLRFDKVRSVATGAAKAAAKAAK
jgi:hypothetical protein